MTCNAITLTLSSVIYNVGVILQHVQDIPTNWQTVHQELRLLLKMPDINQTHAFTNISETFGIYFTVTSAIYPGRADCVCRAKAKTKIILATFS